MAKGKRKELTKAQRKARRLFRLRRTKAKSKARREERAARRLEHGEPSRKWFFGVQPSPSAAMLFDEQGQWRLFEFYAKDHPNAHNYRNFKLVWVSPTPQPKANYYLAYHLVGKKWPEYVESVFEKLREYHSDIYDWALMKLEARLRTVPRPVLGQTVQTPTIRSVVGKSWDE